MCDCVRMDGIVDKREVTSGIQSKRCDVKCPMVVDIQW